MSRDTYLLDTFRFARVMCAMPPSVRAHARLEDGVGSSGARAGQRLLRRGVACRRQRAWAGVESCMDSSARAVGDVRVPIMRHHNTIRGRPIARNPQSSRGRCRDIRWVMESTRAMALRDSELARMKRARRIEEWYVRALSVSFLACCSPLQVASVKDVQPIRRGHPLMRYLEGFQTGAVSHG